MSQALGLIETVGYTTAVSAADAALKAANVTLVAVEKIIGVGGSLGVTIHLSGDVAAVTSAVEAGKNEALRVGKIISAHVIPRAHNDVKSSIISRFTLDEQTSDSASVPSAESTDSAGSAGSMDSMGSMGSAGSTGSTGSADSTGSAGSTGPTDSAGSAGSAFPSSPADSVNNKKPGRNSSAQKKTEQPDSQDAGAENNENS